MMFPLDIIVGLCERSGIAVTRKPKHPDALFSWLSAIPDADPIKEDPIGINVYVVEDLDHAPAGSTCVLTRTDSGSIDAGSDHISISTDLSPTVIADRIQRSLVSIIQWNDEMTQMVEEGCVNQDLLAASEPVLECYVGLSDATFTHIAHTPNVHPLDEHSRYFIEHGCYSKGTVDSIRKSGLMRKWTHQDWTAVNNDPVRPGLYPYADRVIRRRGRYAAHMVMVSPSRIGPHHVFLFDLLAKKVEACLDRHWRLENPLEQRYTYFLREVLSGDSRYTGNMEERASMHGIPVTGLFELYLADDARASVPTEYFAKTVLEEMPSCKIASSGEHLAMLLCMPDGDGQRMAGAEGHLRGLAEKMEIELGASERFDHLEKAAFAMEQARIALRYGQRYSKRFVAFDGSEKADPIYRFRRYFQYFAIDPFSSSEKFVTKLLAGDNPITRLKAADRERGTSDFEILRLYLRSEGRISAVCDAMHMHRNTVAYRLEKIRQTVGDDLDDGDVRMYLRMLYILSD